MILFKRYIVYIFLVLLGVIIPFYLMFHTFSYSHVENHFYIATKVWSDFGSHLPLIRSFSKGGNWPPEYPLFPGEPIRYHYLFYAVVGYFERLGVPIDYSFNLNSFLGFSGLILLVFAFISKIFKSIQVGILTIIFFMFNSSWSIIDFLQKYPFSSNLFIDLINNQHFVSFGPWNGSPISAFWNLNIFTNQRHLGMSFLVTVVLIYLLRVSKNKVNFLIGFVWGSLLLLNQAGFIISSVFIFTDLFFSSGIITKKIISLLSLIPWVILSASTQKIDPQISWQPGYLLNFPFTFYDLFKYWFLNIGLHLFLIPIGFFFAPKNTRFLFLPLILLFVLANLFKFSPDMINNHKFFNFFMLLGSSYSAFIITKIQKINILGNIVSLLLISSLILGGVVDIFPIINDAKISVSDIESNPDVSFFSKSTPMKSIILNSTWFYHPASLAGRSVFNGYSYFTWSYGYNQVYRETLTKRIYTSNSLSEVCSLLKRYNISYVEINKYPEGFISPLSTIWKDYFVPVYKNDQSGIKVYSSKEICSYEN